MDITIVEQAILDRLSPLQSAGLAVQLLANKSNEKGRINENGAVTANWAADDFSVSNSMGLMVQDCLMQFVLDIRLRNLRDEGGAWAVRKAILNLLVGFQPPNCKKMYAQKYEMTERSESVWKFQAIFIVPTVIVEQEAAEVETLLREIFVSEEVNGVDIPGEYQIV